MPVSFAPGRWPATAVGRDGGGWQFGREQTAAAGWVFDLRRHVAIGSHQRWAVRYLSCALSLGLVAGLSWQGAASLGLLAAVGLLALAAALALAARHVGDGELITLGRCGLAVEQHRGTTVSSTAFRLEWVRVEPAADDGSLVQLSGQGRSVRVGRYVRPELRVALAQELRRALRLARAAGDLQVDHEHR